MTSHQGINIIPGSSTIGTTTFADGILEQQNRFNQKLAYIDSKANLRTLSEGLIIIPVLTAIVILVLVGIYGEKRVFK